jgi:protein pelota
MKITHRRIEKDGEGQIGLIAEESDDLWYLYNIIQKGDQVRSPTFRKVVNETSTGSTGARRVKVTLTLSVEKVEYDSEANVVSVKGKSIEENKYVRRGQYHTIDLELNQKFYLTKPVWDSLALSQLNNACDTARNAEVAIVMMQEGLAFVCLITTNMTIQKAKVEVNIPRKRKNFCSQHQKGMDNFYEQVLQAILSYINFDVIKCIVIASPGFVKDQFAEYMWQQAAKRELKTLMDNRQKFLLAHSSTGFKHSIREVLSDPLIQPKLEDTKACQEVKIWNKFQNLLSMEPNKAIYGLPDVELANHYEAIGCMMLSDMLFRSNNLALRKKYSQLLYQVKKYADVRVFSSMHLSGQQLNMLGGIAAILKFEVPELTDRLNGPSNDVDDDSSSSSSSSTSTDSSSQLSESLEDFAAGCTVNDDSENTDDNMEPAKETFEEKGSQDYDNPEEI